MNCAVSPSGVSKKVARTAQRLCRKSAVARPLAEPLRHATLQRMVGITGSRASLARAALQLWDTQCLADHQRPRKDKQQHQRMEFRTSQRPDPPQDILPD